MTTNTDPVRAHDELRVQAALLRTPEFMAQFDPEKFARQLERIATALASAPPSAPEPEVHSYDPTEHRESVTIRWPDGKCLGYVLDRTRYTDNLPPSAPAGVGDEARRLYAMAFNAIAEDGSQEAEEACIRAIEAALAQQPAAPSDEHLIETGCYQTVIDRHSQPATSAEPPYEIDALFDALSNLEHDNYERSYSGSKNREADAGLIRAALERYAALAAQQQGGA